MTRPNSSDRGARRRRGLSPPEQCTSGPCPSGLSLSGPISISISSPSSVSRPDRARRYAFLCVSSRRFCLTSPPAATHATWGQLCGSTPYRWGGCDSVGRLWGRRPERGSQDGPWTPLLTKVDAAFGSLGPDPVSFYEVFATTRTQDALAQLLARLVAARTEDVPSVLRRQRIALLAVAGLFAITAIYSTLLLGVE